MLRSHRLPRIIVVMMVGTIVLKFIPALVGGGWGRIVVAIFTVYLGMGLLRRFLTAFLGPEAGGHVLGTWVLRITDVVFLLPFRILRWLVGGKAGEDLGDDGGVHQTASRQLLHELVGWRPFDADPGATRRHECALNAHPW